MRREASLSIAGQGEAQVKSVVVHGREKIKHTLKSWAKVGFASEVMLVISIVRNIHCISYVCFILVTTD